MRSVQVFDEGFRPHQHRRDVSEDIQHRDVLLWVKARALTAGRVGDENLRGVFVQHR